MIRSSLFVILCMYVLLISPARAMIRRVIIFSFQARVTSVVVRCLQPLTLPISTTHVSMHVIESGHLRSSSKESNLSKGVVRYHKRWDNGYVTCTNGGVRRENVREGKKEKGVRVMAVQKCMTQGWIGEGTRSLVNRARTPMKKSRQQLFIWFSNLKPDRWYTQEVVAFPGARD